jgi:DEAD/DEAH box helicase domain-containing protein
MQHLHQAAGEFDRMQRELENARSRLRDQRSQLDVEEKDAQREIEQELRILQGRANSLSRVSALEVLTDHGLLPNYAFPERGVRFYGAIYNRHQGAEQSHQTIEVIRPAQAALQELAPANHFYTHSRRFDIQQIAIGNAPDPLIEDWAICGACGHMRRVAELHQPDTPPACPQCGHDHDATSQLDRGQQRSFIAFPRSQALSYMEHYDSLSGDRSEEREREFYQIIRSFDLTQDRPTGAVGDEGLPFGIEYRASIILREVNVGYGGEAGAVAFGADTLAPEDGFKVCRDCGVVVMPGTTPDVKMHRRSCSARRRAERLIQENRQGQPFHWEFVYLYRELKSESIRLLLPIADDAWPSGHWKPAPAAIWDRICSCRAAMAVTAVSAVITCNTGPTASAGSGALPCWASSSRRASGASRSANSKASNPTPYLAACWRKNLSMPYRPLCTSTAAPGNRP